MRHLSSPPPLTLAAFSCLGSATRSRDPDAEGHQLLHPIVARESANLLRDPATKLPTLAEISSIIGQ